MEKDGKRYQIAGTARSAWEYAGQKCSACSRMYVPSSLWKQIHEKLAEIHAKIVLGDVRVVFMFY